MGAIIVANEILNRNESLKEKLSSIIDTVKNHALLDHLKPPILMLCIILVENYGAYDDQIRNALADSRYENMKNLLLYIRKNYNIHPKTELPLLWHTPPDMI